MNILQRFFGLGKKAARPQGGTFMFGNQLVMYSDNKEQYIKKGYTNNDLIYSIVKLITDKAKAAPWAVYTVKDEKAYSKLLSLRKDMSTPVKAREANDIAAKALELYTGDAKLNELLQYPNPAQTFSDLNEELFMFKLITGDYFEYWEFAEGGLNTGKPISLSALPSQHMRIKSSGTIPMYEAAYQLHLGQILEYDRESILHEKYVNPEWDMYGNQLNGLAPLKAALRRLQKNNESQIAELSQFKNMGPPRYASPKTDKIEILSNLTWEQASAIKERIDSIFNQGSSSAGSTAIFNMPYEIKDAGLSPVDLAILQSNMVDLRFFCNVWGVPSQLMNDPENKSYNNQSEGEKALTARCAIPLLNSRRDSLNRKLQSLAPYKGKNIVIDYDATVYTELEEDRKEQAEWMSKSPHLTLRMRYQIQNMEIPPNIPDEVLDTVFLPNSWTPAQDLLNQSPDISGDVEALKGMEDYK